jgi:hypothetical protein
MSRRRQLEQPRLLAGHQRRELSLEGLDLAAQLAQAAKLGAHHTDVGVLVTARETAGEHDWAAIGVKPQQEEPSVVPRKGEFRSCRNSPEDPWSVPSVSYRRANATGARAQTATETLRRDAAAGAASRLRSRGYAAWAASLMMRPNRAGSASPSLRGTKKYSTPAGSSVTRSRASSPRTTKPCGTLLGSAA